MKSLLIKNGRIIHTNGHGDADILIQNDSIADMGKNLMIPEGTDILDATDQWVFPGVIDPHTHMGIPIKNGSSADTFATGSRSALHGGVTTILDFTVLESGQSLQQSLDTRIELAKASVCDVGLHVNITRFEPELLEEIPLLIKNGFTSFKVFTTYEEAGMMLDYNQIEAVASIIGEHGGVLMVHSEDNQVINEASAPYTEGVQTHPRFHGLSRPASAESVAVRTLGEISNRSNCTIYIVHLNTAEGLSIASQYPLLKVETCPHYLLLTDDVYEQPDGRMYVASPPLRKQADQDALWQGIQAGSIHTIGSDHCPFCLADKPKGRPFQDIPNGMGGVETLFPTLLAQFVKRGINLSLLVQLTSHNAAQIFGLRGQKGDLAPGCHADLLIVDPTNISNDWEKDLDTILDWNAYAGLPALFPSTVIRRGEIVISNWKTATRSQGVLLKSST